MTRTIRSFFNMQTVRERAQAELAANARDIFATEKTLLEQRMSLALLRKRQAALQQLLGEPA